MRCRNHGPRNSLLVATVPVSQSVPLAPRTLCARETPYIPYLRQRSKGVGVGGCSSVGQRKLEVCEELEVKRAHRGKPVPASRCFLLIAHPSLLPHRAPSAAAGGGAVRAHVA